jgi:hypothetical protein
MADLRHARQPPARAALARLADIAALVRWPCSQAFGPVEKYPCLRTFRASPSHRSSRSALAAVFALQPNSAASSVSVGSLAPAGYSPPLIRRTSSEWICRSDPDSCSGSLMTCRRVLPSCPGRPADALVADHTGSVDGLRFRAAAATTAYQTRRRPPCRRRRLGSITRRPQQADGLGVQAHELADAEHAKAGPF